MDISFKLDSFEGPLDLLLHLIEKNKMDIYDIPISEITRQYMEYISEAGKDADIMSEFLVMAATLLDIKARMLLPPEEDEEGEEIDPRAELVQQLLEYKLYKSLSFELKDMAIGASKQLYKDSDIPKEVQDYTVPINLDVFLKDVDLKKLKEVFDDVMRRSREKVNEEAVKYGRIKRETVSVPEKLDYIRKYTRRHKSFSFRNLISQELTRDNIIVTFLAVLELIKNGQLLAVQDEEKDDIIMYAPSAAPEGMMESVSE